MGAPLISELPDLVNVEPSPFQITAPTSLETQVASLLVPITEPKFYIQKYVTSRLIQTLAWAIQTITSTVLTNTMKGGATKPKMWTKSQYQYFKFH